MPSSVQDYVASVFNVILLFMIFSIFYFFIFNEFYTLFPKGYKDTFFIIYIMILAHILIKINSF